MLPSSAGASGLPDDETCRTNHAYHDAMILCQTFEKKLLSPAAGRPSSRELTEKMLVGTVAAYPGNSPYFWEKGKLFPGWRLMALPKDVALEHRVVMLIVYLKTMNAPMSQNKFFTVQLDESTGDLLRVSPSKYLDELHPYQAIAEMQEYTQTLENALQQCQEESIPIPAKIGKIDGLVFELELVQTFLTSFKQAYGTMH